MGQEVTTRYWTFFSRIILPAQCSSFSKVPVAVWPDIYLQHFSITFFFKKNNFLVIKVSHGQRSRLPLCPIRISCKSVLRKKKRNNNKIKQIIIRCKCFFLFIGREPTTWPANNCLQIMVCSCAMPSNCVWLQIIFCTCVKETVLFSFLRLLLREKGRWLRFPRIFNKKTNSVIEWKNNYWIRLSQNIVIGQCLADQLFASAFSLCK